MILKIKAMTTLFLILYLATWVDSTDDVRENNLPNIGPMNFTQLCDAFGLKCEQHNVVTEDGYILTVHRVVGDKTRPVLLWHGFLDSSDTFLIRGLNSTCAVLAADGFDVWLGNSRGNRYSHRHQYLDPVKDKRKFWDFSFHEMGYYDLAATIDYILDHTGQKKLSAIGHSQGCTMYFVLCSTRPTYNEKVNIFIAMGPAAYLSHANVEILVPAWSALKPILALNGTYELLRYGNIFQKLCVQKIPSLICYTILQQIVGSDPEEMGLDFFHVVMQHFPVGTSKKDADHLVQIVERKKFANYDYGVIENLKKYGAISPPNYDLKKVNSSVALLCGANDKLVTVKDVNQTMHELPNVVYYKVMDRKSFNHIDFIWGKDINVDLNPTLKTLLKKYS